MEKLRRERDSLSFTRKGITRQWTQVLEDMEREHEKEVRKLKKVITELLDMVVSLTDQNRSLEEKKKNQFYNQPLRLFQLRSSLIEVMKGAGKPSNFVDFFHACSFYKFFYSFKR